MFSSFYPLYYLFNIFFTQFCKCLNNIKYVVAYLDFIIIVIIIIIIIFLYSYFIIITIFIINIIIIIVVVVEVRCQ